MQHPLLYQGCMRFVLSVSAEIVVHGAVRQSRRCCQSCTSYCAALVTSEAQTFTDWTERDVAAVWISSPLLLPVLTRRSEWMVTPVFQENAACAITACIMQVAKQIMQQVHVALTLFVSESVVAVSRVTDIEDVELVMNSLQKIILQMIACFGEELEEWIFGGPLPDRGSRTAICGILCILCHDVCKASYFLKSNRGDHWQTSGVKLVAMIIP